MSDYRDDWLTVEYLNDRDELLESTFFPAEPGWRLVHEHDINETDSELYLGDHVVGWKLVVKKLRGADGKAFVVSHTYPITTEGVDVNSWGLQAPSGRIESPWNGSWDSLEEATRYVNGERKWVREHYAKKEAKGKEASDA